MAKRRSRRTRNSKGRFVKGHAAASPKRRRRAKRRSRASESVAMVVHAAPRRKRAKRRAKRRTTRAATVIRVRASKRGRRRITYRTRGRRRSAKAIIVRQQRRGKRRVRVTAIRGRGPHRFALENPLTGSELVIIGVTGVIGATAGDLVDRYLATHALTPVGTSTTSFNDAPDATKKQVYNYQAVAAPMSWQRWLAGVGGSAVFLGVGSYVKSPGWRATWQGMGIGWGLQTLLKGATSLMTMIFGKGAFGERMYAHEIGAANDAKNAANAGYAVAPTPAIGLAAPASMQRQVAQTTSCSACARQNAVGVGCPCTKAPTQEQANAAARNPVVRHPAPALQPAPAAGMAASASQQQPVSVKAPSWRSRQPVMAAYR